MICVYWSEINKREKQAENSKKSRTGHIFIASYNRHISVAADLTVMRTHGATSFTIYTLIVTGRCVNHDRVISLMLEWHRALDYMLTSDCADELNVKMSQKMMKFL